ncbi:MAG: polymerase [Chloroflexi bacterium]|nr:polymerase [Chloroflexota bacterium]
MRRGLPEEPPEAMTRLMLLDGNGLIYRGYFALIETPLTTSKGELVNAVFGFSNIVLRAIQDVRPDAVAIAFDLGRPTFRHERFAEYKATRQRMPDELRDQFPKVRDVVAALSIPVYEQEGFEADDVIATLVDQAEASGLETTIVTGDLDMLQLVSERTRLMVSLRGGVANTVVYDLGRIEERWSLRPDQMLDYKALKGDPTDNIPGVPGVGEKTAARLVGTFGTLDALYERIDEVQPEKLRAPLLAAKEQVLESRELMRLVHDVPVTLDVEAAVIGDYDREAVVRLFREFEFRTLVDRLPPLRGERPEEATARLREAAAGTGAARAPGTIAGAPPGPPAGDRRRSAEAGGLQLSLDFDAVSGARPRDADRATTAMVDRSPLPAGDLRDALAALIADPGLAERLDAAGVAALPAWLASLPAVGVACPADDPRPRKGTPLALALAGADGRVVTAPGPELATAARKALEAAGTPLVGHEVKPLLVARLAEEPDAVPTAVAFDTQVAAYLLNASLRGQGIADVVAERLDLVLPPAAAGLEPPERAALEALAALAVRVPLEPALEEAGLARLFAELELPLIPVLARLEATGVAIDREALAALDTEFGAELARLEREIYDAVGHEFGLGSPKQLEQVLFYELNLPRGKRTKTGYSTDASVLEELRGAHPMVEKLLDWRLYSKLRSTYIAALPGLIAGDGRLHTTFHQAVAATGRLSSSDPNLQNIPIRTELGRRIRRAFVAGDPARTLVSADYSQIELRILAHVSGDPHLREAFAEGHDIHRETAALVLHKEPAEVTAAERSMAKMVNFGIAYGMSDYGLSSRAGIPLAEAKAFIERYFATYSGISYYMLHVKEQARRDGAVRTLLGRRREIPELRSSNRALIGAGERMAINMPIQGTAADIMKIAMIRVDRRLRAEGLRARVLLQVHDELLLDAPREEVERLVPLVRDTMEGALVLDVPLTVEVKAGDDWESMVPVRRGGPESEPARPAPADFEPDPPSGGAE